MEHQKLNQVVAQLPPGWVFGVQLDYSYRIKSTAWSGPCRSLSCGYEPFLTLSKYDLRIVRIKTLKLFYYAEGWLDGWDGNKKCPIFHSRYERERHGPDHAVNFFRYEQSSGTPTTQTGGSSAANWLSFCCSTRLLIPKKVNGMVRTTPLILIYKNTSNQKLR